MPDLKNSRKTVWVGIAVAVIVVVILLLFTGGGGGAGGGIEVGRRPS